MSLPDFIGMDPDYAAKILETQYPQISCRFRSYSSPKDRRNQDIDVVYRIIRQQPIGDNQLEFIISPFYLMNEKSSE